MESNRHAQDARPKVEAAESISAGIESSLKVGAVCGSAGFLFGGTAGIIRGAPPFLFATASALQTFGLGTAYWGCRTGILHAWTPAHQTPYDLVKASAISGGFTGGVVALITRGRSNVIPGAIMMSLFGFLGQTAYNRYSIREKPDESKPGFWRRMMDKKYSPVTVLSNEEYASMLQEKILKVDVEIAILDDKISALRGEQQNHSVNPSDVNQR